MAGHADQEWVANRLFIAVPELAVDLDFLRNANKLGLIDDKEYQRLRVIKANADRAGRTFDKMEGKTLMERLLLVAPEILSASTVGLLRATGVISVKQGNILRSMISFGAVLNPWNRDDTLDRVAALLGLTASSSTIDLLRSLGRIDEDKARKLRGLLDVNKQIGSTKKEIQNSKKAIDILHLLYAGIVGDDMLRGMVRLGVVTPRVAALYKHGSVAGKRVWRAFQGANQADGWIQRGVMALTGSFHSDVVDQLFNLGYIDKKWRIYFYGAEAVSTRANDRMLEGYVRRRYRIEPGTPPIVSFGRQSRKTEQEILKLLAEAAKEAGDTAKLLDLRGGSASARAAQLRLVRAELHSQMRALWENSGHLLIFGETEAAESAVESMDALRNKWLKGAIGPDLEDSLTRQAKNGVDLYISRQENLVPLSRRVYKNIALVQGKIDKTLNLGLLQGKTAAEIASDVEKYINPNVPGGVKYAARRLAVTEMNNAFHLQTIRYTREQPWIKGYQWHLSGRHGRPDICNEYADDDHDNLGPGVFKKNNVPGKPHPFCLCFLTPVSMTQAEFMRARGAGRFTQYFKTLEAA